MKWKFFTTKQRERACVCMRLSLSFSLYFSISYTKLSSFLSFFVHRNLPSVCMYFVLPSLLCLCLCPFTLTVSSYKHLSVRQRQLCILSKISLLLLRSKLLYTKSIISMMRKEGGSTVTARCAGILPFKMFTMTFFIIRFYYKIHKSLFKCFVKFITHLNKDGPAHKRTDSR